MKYSKSKGIFSRYLTILCLLIALAAVTTACAEKTKKEPPEKAKKLLEQMEQLKIKQREKLAELKRMNVLQLHEKLQAHSSKGVEPFNSMAYREMVSRGTAIAPELKELIQKPEPAALLPLLALREIDAQTYNTVDPTFRTQVFVNSLKTSKTFNTWGIPHLYWEPAAKAVIELGDRAVEALKLLLEDKRPAPVWGSEEVMEYEKYKYRVCDYALALINAIMQQKTPLPTSPEERDQLIEKMYPKEKPQ